jgi:hypothetical protein
VEKPLAPLRPLLRKQRKSSGLLARDRESEICDLKLDPLRNPRTHGGGNPFPRIRRPPAVPHPPRRAARGCVVQERPCSDDTFACHGEHRVESAPVGGYPRTAGSTQSGASCVALFTRVETA